MAAATRLLMSSILPKRTSAGSEESDIPYSAIAGAAPMASTISEGNPKRTCSGMTSISRILVKPCSSKKVTALLHKDLWGRGASRQPDSGDFSQPLRLDRAIVLDQMGFCAQIAGNF